MQGARPLAPLVAKCQGYLLLELPVFVRHRYLESIRGLLERHIPLFINVEFSGYDKDIGSLISLPEKPLAILPKHLREVRTSMNAFEDVLLAMSSILGCVEALSNSPS